MKSSESRRNTLTYQGSLGDTEYVARALLSATTVNPNDSIYQIPFEVNDKPKRVQYGADYYVVSNANPNTPIEVIIKSPRIGTIIFDKGLFTISYSLSRVNREEMDLKKINSVVMHLRAQDRKN